MKICWSVFMSPCQQRPSQKQPCTGSCPRCGLLPVRRFYKGNIMHMPKRLPVTLGSTSAFDVQTYFAGSPDYAVAQSTSGEIGVTWNPDPTERPNGFPHSYSHQPWFILRAPLARMVLAGATLFDGQ